MLEVRNENILMTVCIPVFNSANTIKNMINSIIVSKRNDFEVLVVDSGSSDNTLEIVREISDCRVRTVCIEKTVTYGEKIFESGKYAEGKYLMYAIDRHCFSSYKFDELLEYLEHKEDILGGMCAPLKTGQYMVYENTIDKLTNFAYQQEHIVGHFFLTDLYKSFANQVSEMNYGIFPFEYIYALICLLKGKLVKYNVIYQVESDYICCRNLTRSNKPNKDAYYMPIGRIKFLHSAIKHLCRLEISQKEKYKVASKLYKMATKCFLNEYKYMMTDTRFCTHNRLKMKYIEQYKLWFYHIMMFCVYFANCIKIALCRVNGVRTGKVEN